MTKIEGLKQTIYNLENDVYEYNWMGVDTCNCGVLARTLLGGRTAKSCGLNDSPKKGSEGAFAKHAFCMTTNLPLPEVFQVLKDAGFTHQELLHLELLNDKNILSRIIDKEERFTFSSKTSLIKYLKAWVEILQEDQLAIVPAIIEAPKERTRIVYVPVSESIKQMEVVKN